MTLAIHDMEIREEAREEGKELSKVSDLRLVMEKLKISADKAMDFLDIPAEEQPKYALLLKKE